MLVFGLLLLGGELDFVLVGEFGELVLEGFDLVFEEGDFFGVGALLFFHLVLDLLDDLLFTVLELLPFFEDLFLQSFLFHFVVVLQLNDRELDVALLLLEILGVLLVQDKNLPVVVFFLQLDFLLELLGFGLVGLGEF